MPSQFLQGRMTFRVTLAAVLAGMFFGSPAAAADTLTRRATKSAQAESQKSATSKQKTAAAGKGKGAIPNVELRRPRLPAVPPGSGLSNPVDRLLAAHFKSQGVDMGKSVPDAVFARRVYLDLIGLLPPPAELDAFLADTRRDKRTLLVRRLLERQEDYAVAWLGFWNDLLRNEYRGTGFIDDGRRQITRWLFGALYDNMPYDRFVHKLVSPVPGSEGFIKGIEWRGVVNASQRREMQAAQTTAQVFLGTNLKCASCHDSFISRWTLADSHGLAATFADGSFDIYRCDKATGQHAQASFLFPQVGTIDRDAPRPVRMKQLADRMTSPADGRLAKTVVNRYWARLMGRGLVEPLDNMEQEAWNPDLLDWLAADLVDHGYDLKRTLETICTSRTYQLPSVGEERPGEGGDPLPFRGPSVRRMTAEQFIDAVNSLTGVWPKPTNELIKMDGRGQGGQLGAVRDVISHQSPGTAGSAIRVRAALLMDDPLSRALGRPNREQVVTRRDSLATMLQALELVNGTTLDEMLNSGAREWIRKGRPEKGQPDSPSPSPLTPLPEGEGKNDREGEGKNDRSRQIVARAYRLALGRQPTRSELDTAGSVVGSPPSVEGVHDLLWLVVMLPEFQLIE